MSQPIKNIGLIGATGNLGPAVVKALVESKKFNVTVFSRKESTSTTIDGAHLVKVNYDSDEELLEQFQRVDAVVSLVGHMLVPAQARFIKLAKKAGVKRFVPSDFGVDTTYDKVLEIAPIFQGKTDIITQLRGEVSDDFTFTSLITGSFFDWCLEVGFYGFDFQKKTADIWDGGDVKFSVTNLGAIGQALVNIFSNQSIYDDTKNQLVHIDSFTVTLNEILKEVRKHTDGDWTVVKTRHEDNMERLQNDLSKGQNFGEAVPFLIKASFLNRPGWSNWDRVGRWNDRLGLKKESFEATVEKVVPRALKREPIKF